MSTLVIHVYKLLHFYLLQESKDDPADSDVRLSFGQVAFLPFTLYISLSDRLSLSVSSWVLILLTILQADDEDEGDAEDAGEESDAESKLESEDSDDAKEADKHVGF